MKGKKRLAIVISLLFMFWIQMIQAYAVKADMSGIVAAWNMEPSGNKVFDSSKNKIDLIAESIERKDGGISGSYSLFSGGQFASCQHNTNLGGFEQLSVSLWVKPESNHINADMLLDKDGAFRLSFVDENTLQFVVATENNAWYSKHITQTAPIEIGVWSHIACVYDGQEMLMYFNGKLIGRESEMSGKIATLNSPFYISRLENIAANSNYQRGIDEVRLYGKALTDTDIRTLYKEGTYHPSEPLHPNLIGLWNEIEDTTILDSIGANNGNVGTAGGVSYVVGPDGKDALKFEGGTVHVPDNPRLDGMDSLTLSAWVSLSELPQNDGFVLLGKDNADASYRIRVHNNGELSFAIATENNKWYSKGTAIVTVQKICPGLWYYISAEYDGSNIFLYVNGELWAKSATKISGAVKNTSSELLFGSTTCGEALHASVQDICIYNIALRQDELKAIYEKKKWDSYLLNVRIEEGSIVDRSQNEFEIITSGAPVCSEENGMEFIQFDGVDDAIAIEGISDYMNGLDTLSLRAKIRITGASDSSNKGLFSRDGNDLSNISFHSFITGDMVQFSVKSDGMWYSGNFNSLSGLAPKAGVWRDLELRYNKGQLQYFLDGVLEGQAFTGNGGKIDNSNIPLYIGVFQDNYLKADLSDIMVSGSLIADAEIAANDKMGNEEMAAELQKEIRYNSLPELYIPTESKFTYNLVLLVNNEPTNSSSFIISVENPSSGISVEDGKIVIDQLAVEGNLKLKLVYKYDTTIVQNVVIPIVKFDSQPSVAVNIEGNGKIDQILKATYDYYNPKLKEKSVEYCWVKSQSKEGEYSYIPNAKTATYTPTLNDEGCYIKAGVKVTTILHDYIAEQIPTHVQWSAPVVIKAERTNRGGGSVTRVSNSTDIRQPIKDMDTVSPNNPEIDRREEKGSFDDIDGHWAYDDIIDLKAKGVIYGISENEFAPDIPVTRAEAAALVARALKLTEIGETHFADVEYGWYFESVKKTAAASIMNGSNGFFRPNDVITREELAKIADNIMKRNGKDTFKEYYVINSFNDRAEISSWAEEAVMNACGEKIMCGVGEQRFAPKEAVTRAQIAVVLSRLLKM